MVFAHFCFVKAEKLFLSLDSRLNHLLSFYFSLVATGAEKTVGAVLSLVRDDDGRTLGKVMRDLVEEGDLQKLLPLAREMSEQNRSALTASVLRAQNATPSKKTRLIDALLNEKLLVTSCPIDKFGWTLLHKAVYENNVQLVDVLLKHGASPADPDTNGNTPLHVAIQSCQTADKPASRRMRINELNSIEAEGSYQSHYATVVDVVKRLISASQAQSQSVVNKANYFGKTPLHYAVLLHPNVLARELVDVLIEEGADIDRVDARGRTPLFYLLSNYKYSNSNLTRYKLMLLINALVKAGCDTLNLTDLLGEVSSLKQMCRLSIVSGVRGEPDALKSILPNELVDYLKRRVLT